VWEDENKEVVYKGHLYDIVDIQVVNEKVVLTVVSDTQEMKLKKQFASMYDENDVNQSSQPAKLLKQLLSLKCICHYDVFEFIKTTNVISFFQSNRFVIQTGVQCVETPPPNLS
jgi:hypothetical protein